tara:strand:+ start:232 stop:645 length:414 start_codon:yes stop_codon:yes gene_type:complete
MEITQSIIGDFLSAYPQFDNYNYTNTIIVDALCNGDFETGSKKWGSYSIDCHNYKRKGMFTYAAFYLVAFYPCGTSKPASEAKRSIQSQSIGDKSVAYNTSNDTNNKSADASFLGSNIFGQQFMRLRRMKTSGFVVL